MSSTKYVLAIDQGTTGSTAALINARDFSFVDDVGQDYPQIYPSPGLVEHNLNQIWDTVRYTVTELLKRNNLTGKDIASIGITNQRETTCAFDNNGNPLANAIVWQDRRTHEYCKSLQEKHAASIKTKTGLPIDPYFSASKMNWLLKNNEKVQNAAKNKNLKFGTIDTFLLYKLTDKVSYATEPSNASRTLLFNLKETDWDKDLLNLFEVKREFLPNVQESFSLFGKTKNCDFLPDDIPITGILGDQQSALFGQACLNKGDMKCTYGTGAFLLLNTGSEIKYSNSGLVTTIAYKYQGKTFYALEGSCYIAGAAIQWLRDNLKIIAQSHESEALARKVKSLTEMENILLLPFFTGIGSPYWISQAKAAIVGITRDTENSHLARAALDGISFSVNDIVVAMGKDLGEPIKALKVDGGAVQNNLLMEIQSTISQLDIIRPANVETTSYGAALASLVGNKQLSIEEINKFWKIDKKFSPNTNESAFYAKKFVQWKDTIKRLYF
ncbi:MAG: glycerol kinase GlpK [Bacteriovoracaceae bacterium]